MFGAGLTSCAITSRNWLLRQGDLAPAGQAQTRQLGAVPHVLSMTSTRALWQRSRFMILKMTVKRGDMQPSIFFFVMIWSLVVHLELLPQEELDFPDACSVNACEANVFATASFDMLVLARSASS